MSTQVETRRRQLARYGIVAAIVLVVGGTFAYREWIAPADADVEQTAEQVEVGAPAPDFTLDTPDGTFRLSEARGEVVLLNFWATWCGPCRFEMPEFQELHHTRGERDGIRVVAVNLTSADSREGAIAFAEELGLTFTIAFDDTGSITESYGVRGLPATFFIDREGVIRALTYGPVLGERLAESIAAAGG